MVQLGKTVNPLDIVALEDPADRLMSEPDRKTAIAYCREIIEQYGDVYPEAIAILEDGLEDSLQFYAFP